MSLTRTLLFFIFSIASFNPAAAKENKDLMKASYYYSHFDYFEAIPYYEKIAGEMNDPVIYTRLADCYSATGNFSKAVETYSKAVAIKGCSNDVLLRYGQLLMQQSQYEEAGKWLNEYLAKIPNDKRASNLIAACSSAKSKLQVIPQGTATLLLFNTDGSEFAPTLWQGKLVFASDTAVEVHKKTDNWSGKSYYSIYSLPCDGKGNCQSGLTKLTETKQLNNKYHDGPATFTSDGTRMYYTRSRYKNNFLGKKYMSNKDSVVLLEIMVASDFDTATKKFKTVRPFEYNSEDYSVAHPSVSPSGNMLAFSSNKPKGQGGSDIYICKKIRDSWSKPQNAGGVINTEGEEVFPCWADDSTLFFSSDGHEGLGGLDIYKSTWSNNTNSFSPPENVGIPVNSSYDDISLAMYADLRSTYFSSNRPASKGSDNIYFYKKEKIFLQLIITDSLTRQPLSGVAVSINAPHCKLDTTASGDGKLFKQLYPDDHYTLQFTKGGYSSANRSFNATSQKEIDTLIAYVSLWTPPVVVKQPDTPAHPETPPDFTKILETPEVDKIYELGHFYFAYNSVELSDTAKGILDSLAGYLAKKTTMRIEVRAHTDCRGGDAFNLKLSNGRAGSVVTYLKKKGIAANRLESVGFGMRQPKVECPICEKCTEAQYYLNRVLEFRILKL